MSDFARDGSGHNCVSGVQLESTPAEFGLRLDPTLSELVANKRAVGIDIGPLKAALHLDRFDRTCCRPPQLKCPPSDENAGCYREQCHSQASSTPE
jgi:hypothetical protein